MRTGFSFLRSLSSLRTRSHSSSSAAVVPINSDYFTTTSSPSLKSLPVKSPPPSPTNHNNTVVVTTAAHLSDLITSAITSHKLAKATISRSGLNESDINVHLEDGVVLLDACQSVLERIDLVKEYIESIRTAVRRPSKRVNELLDDQKYVSNETAPVLERSYSSLLKRAMNNGDDDESANLLSGLRLETLKACHFLESALSFKKRKSSSISLRNNKKVVGQMAQLKEVVVLVERLRDLKHDEDSVNRLAQVLKNKCGELECVIQGLEIGVRELYSQLIYVRMMLL